MKKFLKYRVTVSVMVLVVIIPLSVWVGITRTAGNVEDQLRALYSDTDGEGVGRYSDINGLVSEYIENAKEIKNIADGFGQDTADFDPILSEFDSEKEPFIGKETFLKLADAVSGIYYRISSAGLAEEDSNRLTECYRNTESIRIRLGETDAYHACAEQYNRMLTSFPGSLFLPGKSQALVFK